MGVCKNCYKKLITRKQVKYCSVVCQKKYQYKLFIIDWKNGGRSGERGINTKGISGYVKKYLFEKYKNKCSKCGWNKKHPTTGNIPLEIDHVDGNSENNHESNLRLLCPNCHALTPFFKNLNKGNGRKWKSDKYIKNN